jgi:hypothetical protein
MKLARTVALVIVGVLFVGWALALVGSEFIGAYRPREHDSAFTWLPDGGIE